MNRYSIRCPKSLLIHLIPLCISGAGVLSTSCSPRCELCIHAAQRCTDTDPAPGKLAIAEVHQHSALPEFMFLLTQNRID